MPLKYDRDAAFSRIVDKDRVDIPIIPALQGKEMVMEYAPDYRGEPVLASTRYIPELEWGLVAKIDETEVNAIVTNTNQFLFRLEIFMIVVALMLGLLVAYYISRPIERLTVNTRKVAKNEYSPLSEAAGFAEANTLIAEFNSMARELSELRHRLGEKVDERTSELNLANQELQKITDELRRSNTVLEQFAFITSHDLQEPVRTISTIVDMLSEDYADKLDEDGKQCLHFLKDSSERMIELIKGLLEYSRVGRSAEPEAVDLAELVQEIVADFSVTIEELGAVVEIQQLPCIHGYRTELRALFQNLISNALKFRHEAVVPHIEIGANLFVKEWQFHVRDNGIGLSMDHNNKVFLIFQRLHDRDTYEGEGMGLALCKKIVDLHHGRIWYEPATDQGTIFYFTLKEMNE